MQGRPVKIGDGTTLLTPDTPANQAAWPQARTQKPGVGFPILRMVVLLSLATAALCGVAVGPYKGKQTGEPALLRELWIASKSATSSWAIVALPPTSCWRCCWPGA